MTHTLPDYTTKYKMAKIFGQIDSGELAARLGSPLTLDRRGNLIWMDDFEGTSIKWETAVDGAGTVSLNAGYSYSGSQSLKLTTSATDEETVRIYKNFPHPTEQNLGIEFMLRLPASQFILTLFVQVYDGSVYFDARFQYILDANEISVHDKAVGYTTIADSALSLFEYEMWMYFKLVLDWEGKKFVRLIAGNKEFDLSAHSIVYAANETLPKVKIRIQLATEENVAKTAYLDDFILTQNEP